LEVKLNILIINDYGGVLGGAELQVLSLRAGLRERGHNVRLFAARTGNPPILVDASCFAFGGPLQVLSMWRNPFAVSALRQELSAHPPDLIHLAMYRWQLSPSILELLAGIPTICQVQLYEPICPMGTKLLPDGSPCRELAGAPCRANRCLSRAAAPFLLAAHETSKRFWPRFARRIAVSDWQRNRLEADGLAIDCVIPNGVPLESASPAPLDAQPHIVCASRLVREKGIDQLLRASALLAADFPTLKLTIAGDGPATKSLRELAATLPSADRISWLGYVPRDQLSRHFRGAWLQVVPGIWEEPFGLATAEAMMRGLPVVAPANGASGELLADGAFGALYPNHDHVAMSSAIRLLLSNPDRLPHIGRAAQAHAIASYSESVMVDRLLSLYQEALA
jgi:glycosyltransferase involved in cell wall biosynthesis